MRGRGASEKHVVRHLPKLDLRHHAAIERTLRAKLAAWNAEGWAFVGRPPRMRVAVFVDKKLAAPRNAATTIRLPASLGGHEHRVEVVALHRHAAPPQRTATSGLAAGAGTTFLAPGAPIGGGNERIGIGAVMAVDGAPSIFTCGHCFDANSATITTLDGNDIGTLVSNYFGGSTGLDAAVFAVNDRGLDLLAAGAQVNTWCGAIREPAASDNGAEVTFWPTWNDDLPSFVEDVTAFSACTPAGIGCGYVMLPRCTVPGDSGSTLQRAGAYYALASQRDGNYSFFTPIAAIRKRLLDDGHTVTSWRPS